MVNDISPQDFLARRAAGADMTLLDVREDWEIQLAPVPADLVHIPMGQIGNRLSELDPHKETVVICRSGGRNMEVARFLTAQGFSSVSNLAGGILRWSREVDPRIPQY
jgi:rhodanese-related sulfurtransferase